MELYDSVSRELAKVLTTRYSTSFSLSSRLFSSSMRPEIYAIYGLVRIADEIVDTYRGDDARTYLAELYEDAVAACRTGYSTNPIVHAYAHTAHRFGIGEELLAPFFESMAMDIEQRQFSEEEYARYIYGSAEVIGLMCLKVFVGGDQAQYQALTPGARALGAAYQKINFLRDFAADYRELNRVYFPGVSYETFSDTELQQIIDDIEADIKRARAALEALPPSARRAVRASLYYYGGLLSKLRSASPESLKTRRYRLSDAMKLLLLGRAYLGL